MYSQKLIEYGRELYNYFVLKDAGLIPDQSNPHYAGLGQCWGWKGYISSGYANVKVGKKTILAHRLSYILHKGEIPNGMVIMHRCDNKICTNPDHLELGTRSQNSKDAHLRGLCKGSRSKKRLSFNILMATLASKAEIAMKNFLGIFWELHKHVENSDPVLEKLFSDKRFYELQASLDELFAQAVAEYNPSLISDEILTILATRRKILVRRHKDRLLLAGDNERILSSPRWTLDPDLP